MSQLSFQLLVLVLVDVFSAGVVMSSSQESLVDVVDVVDMVDVMDIVVSLDVLVGYGVLPISSFHELLLLDIVVDVTV